MSQKFGQSWQSDPAQQEVSAPSAQGDNGESASPLRPLDLGDILDGMFRLVVRHWRPLLLALAPVLVAVNAAVSIASGRIASGPGLLEVFRNPALAEAQTVSVGEVAPLIAASLLSSLLVSPYLYGVSMAVAARGTLQQAVEVGPLVRGALRRYPALVGVYVSILVIVGLTFAPGAGLVAAGALLSSPPLAAVGAVALLAAVPAALAVGVSFALALPAAVEEPIGPVRALRRSTRLVRGRFWRTLGIVALAYLITNIVSLLATLPFGVPGTLFGGALGATFTGLGGTVSGLLATPLLGAALTLLYLDARVRKEGIDLEQMLERMP